MRKTLIAFSTGAFVALAAAAQATEFCDIPKTRDGFVALRSAPFPHAALAARMRVGDEVLADGGVLPRNGWYFVRWWKGGRFRPEGYGFGKPSGKGWMNGRFMQECG